MISFQSKRHWHCFLPQTQNNLEWILFWRIRTISIFRVPPEDGNSKFLWNTATQTTCYPNLHPLCLFTTVKTWSKKPSAWFMQEKLNYKNTLCSEPMQCNSVAVRLYWGRESNVCDDCAIVADKNCNWQQRCFEILDIRGWYFTGCCSL